MSDCIDHGQKRPGGYGKKGYNVNGKQKFMALHRWVFFQHNGYYPPIVRHTCDNPRCINPEHLVGGTHQDNMDDRRIRGRLALCTGRPPSLTPEQIDAIRNSTLSESQLGAAYGISPAQAGRIRRGQRCGGR